jgi:hypothetical protein
VAFVVQTQVIHHVLLHNHLIVLQIQVIHHVNNHHVQQLQ